MKRYAIFTLVDRPARGAMYIRKEATATGTHMRMIQGLNLPAGGNAAVVTDAAHSHVGESVDDTGNHHDVADGESGNAHNIGVELHEHHGGQNEGKVIAEIAEQIAQLVAETKRAQGLLVRIHFLSTSFYYFVGMRLVYQYYAMAV